MQLENANLMTWHIADIYHVLVRVGRIGRRHPPLTLHLSSADTFEIENAARAKPNETAETCRFIASSLFNADYTRRNLWKPSVCPSLAGGWRAR